MESSSAGSQMRRVRSPICYSSRHAARGQRHTAKRPAWCRYQRFARHRCPILTSSITGLPSLHVEDVQLSDIRIVTVMPGKPEWVTNPVPEVPAEYPQSRMFGWLPASGFQYVRHVHGLSMRNVFFSAPVEEWRPTLLFDDVQDLRCDSLQSTPTAKGEPMVQMEDVNGAWLSQIKAPMCSRALLKVEVIRGRSCFRMRSSRLFCSSRRRFIMESMPRYNMNGR